MLNHCHGKRSESSEIFSCMDTIPSPWSWRMLKYTGTEDNILDSISFMKKVIYSVPPKARENSF